MLVHLLLLHVLKCLQVSLVRLEVSVLKATFNEQNTVNLGVIGTAHHEIDLELSIFNGSPSLCTINKHLASLNLELNELIKRDAARCKSV